MKRIDHIQEWRDGQLISERIVEVEIPAFACSKLEVRRALRRRGLEQAFNAALASQPTAEADWYDAQELRTDDPILAQMLPAFCAMLGLTDGDVQAILEEARIK